MGKYTGTGRVLKRWGKKNLVLMTKAVIDGKTKNETTNRICFPTDFKKYLKNVI